MSQPQNWSDWFKANLPDMWELFQSLIQKPVEQPDWTIDKWQPTTEDKAFAWEIYVELRTRISTQPLHFLSGDEATALDSLFRLFQIVRDLEKKHGVGGFVSASLTNFVLNSDIRPVTARWHKMKLEGKLHPEDLRREFRATLQKLQPRLRAFQSLMLRIAGGHFADGSDAELKKVSKQETRSLEASFPYDRLLGYACTCKVPSDCLCKVPPEKIVEIVAAETREIHNRRIAVQQVDRIFGPCGRQSAHLDQLLTALKPVRDERGEDTSILPVNDVVGLSISGGGIRSATFALGILQGLTQRGILKQVDLVSTVSGGGYLGSFLSTYLNTDDPKCGPTNEQAPFKPEVAGDSRAIRSLRNHSRYIQPSNFDRWLTTFGQVVYGIVSNLIILSFWVFLAVLATFIVREQLRDIRTAVYANASSVMPADAPAGPVIKAEPGRKDPDQESEKADVAKADGKSEPPEDKSGKTSVSPDYWQLTDFTKGWIVATGTLLFLLPIAQRIQRKKDPIQARVHFYEQLTIVFFVLMLVIVLIDQLPVAHYGYISFMKWVGDHILKANPNSSGWSLTASMVTAGNLMGLLIARAKWVRDLARAFPLLGRGVFLLLWLCGPLLCAFAYFELCRVYIADPGAGLSIRGSFLPAWGLISILAAGSFAYSYMCNVNFTSLHRFYRNRLSATYLLGHSATGEPEVKGVQKLSELRLLKGAKAPYHLLNGALNLPSSEIDDLRGRNSDFFLFSKHYCGSPVVGYNDTKQWEKADPHLDLGTAMAISGAAAAPQMGMGSIKGASFLMTLLNVRMAYWLRKPFCENCSNEQSEIFTGPGPQYLAREALNLISEKSPYLNVSDGGHLENLAIYELLRRRCKFIIAIDGEHDPELTFPSLRRLQRFAEVDLGVTIDMDVERIEWDLPSMFQPSDKGERLVEDKAAERRRPEPLIQRFSRGHFAVGKISYPEIDGKDAEGKDAKVPVTGWLLYIKLSITGNEPDYIHDYRREHPDFPHQTTNDQVFEEDQFEAYRALGEHVAEDLFAPEIVANCPNATNAPDQSFEVHDWFQGLATTML